MKCKHCEGEVTVRRAVVQVSYRITFSGECSRCAEYVTEDRRDFMFSQMWDKVARVAEKYGFVIEIEHRAQGTQLKFPFYEDQQAEQD